MVQQYYQRILVAIDGSERAEIAFKKAVEIAIRNNGLLVVTHIVDTHSFQAFTGLESRITDERFLEQMTATARDTLASYLEYAKERGLDKIESILRHGSPKIEIAEKLPREYGIDLIVLGATGMNAFTRLFIGSVSEFVVRNAPCDVLIVRTEHTDKERINTEMDNNDQ